MSRGLKQTSKKVVKPFYLKDDNGDEIFVSFLDAEANVDVFRANNNGVKLVETRTKIVVSF